MDPLQVIYTPSLFTIFSDPTTASYSVKAAANVAKETRINISPPHFSEDL